VFLLKYIYSLSEATTITNSIHVIDNNYKSIKNVNKNSKTNENHHEKVREKKKMSFSTIEK
jgi:hypothetical protein